MESANGYKQSMQANWVRTSSQAIQSHEHSQLNSDRSQVITKLDLPDSSSSSMPAQRHMARNDADNYEQMVRTYYRTWNGGGGAPVYNDNETLNTGIIDSSSTPTTVNRNHSRNSSQIYLAHKQQDELAAKLFALNARLYPNKTNGGEGKHRCCWLCRCSKRYQSDSSLWSMSDTDTFYMPKPLDNQCESIQSGELFDNRLSVPYDNKYSHLTRVITPPNAFLSQSPFGHPAPSHQPETVSYSNKRTQTDLNYTPNPDRNPLYHQQALQRHHSLVEPRESRAFLDLQTGTMSFDCEHIYHTIDGTFVVPQSRNTTPQTSTPSNRSSHQTRQQGPSSTEPRKRAYISRRSNASVLDDPSLFRVDDVPRAQGQDHRIPMSKDGIPCSCNQCRESRGLNLTTELLPLDAQMPLQSMDGFDAFLQDSSDLICTIL